MNAPNVPIGMPYLLIPVAAAVTAQLVPDELLGPVGLTIFAIVVATTLARYGWRLLREYIDNLKAQITTQAAQYERRIAEVIGERDAWQTRSLESDERLERISLVFERVTKTAAPE